MVSPTSDQIRKEGIMTTIHKGPWRLSTADAREVLDHREEYPPEMVSEAEEIMTAAGWE
jgi:hypothetical protein